MGVRFTELATEAREQLESYIETRARIFQI